MRESHDDLVKVVKAGPSGEWANRFLDVAADLIDITGVTRDDDQLVMSIRTDQKALPVTIGMRYCWKGYFADRMIGAIFPDGSRAVDELRERARYVGQFNGEEHPPHYYKLDATSADDFIFPEYRKDWEQAVKAERERGHRRHQGDSHEPAVYRAATDPSYRRQVLNDAGFDS
jgi:hypothetical protein